MTEEKIATYCEDCDIYHCDGLHKAHVVRRQNLVNRIGNRITWAAKFAGGWYAYHLAYTGHTAAAWVVFACALCLTWKQDGMWFF